MNVFVSTAAPRAPRGLWDVLAALAAHDLRAVELGFCRLDSGERDLVPRLQETGLDLLVHNYFPPAGDDLVLNLASSDPRIAAASLAFVLRSLELTAAVGAPFYSMHCGFVTDPVGFDGSSYVLPPAASDAQVEAAGERFAEAVDRVLARAEELGLGLLVENSVCTEELRGKLLLLTAAELAAFFDRFSGRPLALLLDTGHLRVTATTLGFDPDEFVAALADRVRAFHLHDNDGVVDRHLPPGAGSWPLELVLGRRFAGVPVVVEARFETPADAAAYARLLDGSVREREAEPAR